MTTVNLSDPSPSIVDIITQKTPVSPQVTPMTQSSNQSSGDTLTLSGHAMLLSRLFHTNDLNAQPPVETIITKQNLVPNTYSFLRIEDRKLLERAYEYASANGMDPLQVDGLAFDLSFYRHMQNSGTTAEITGMYDLDGNPWVGKFNSQDAEQAKSILTSQAINETDIDKGFLATILNPQISGLHHAVSFEALEKFISVLSPSGGKPAQDSKAAEPVQPTDAGLAQALYRIDHPYVGEKWVQAKTQNSGDQQPLQHLSKSDIKQLTSAYQLTLLQGTVANLQSLDQMSELVGIARMLQEGSLHPQAASEHLAKLLNSSVSPDTGSVQQGSPIKLPHIDTSV